MCKPASKSIIKRAIAPNRGDAVIKASLLTNPKIGPTSKPNKRGVGGTQTGTYTARVMNLTADMYSWDAVMTETKFNINP